MGTWNMTDGETPMARERRTSNDQRRFLRRVFVRDLALCVDNFFAIWIQGLVASGFTAAAFSIWSAMLSDKSPVMG